MTQLISTCFLLLSLIACNGQKKSKIVNQPYDFKHLLVDIREQSISEADARKKFKKIIFDLSQKYPTKQLDSANYSMVFPLKSKNYKSVGGRGRGFYGRHFNLFNHSVSKSHPAHDIFIYDLDRDCKDDNDGNYVDVLSVNDGLVIAVENNWTDSLDYKGGNYVWVYDFESGGLWYYAHLREAYVVKNQLVQAGDKLGEVGRTGFNAENNRSDTHLHLMYLAVNDKGEPRPVNHYPWLKKATTVYTTHLPYHYPRTTFAIQQKMETKPVKVPPNHGVVLPNLSLLF